jgi:hypothetical protein
MCESDFFKRLELYYPRPRRPFPRMVDYILVMGMKTFWYGTSVGFFFVVMTRYGTNGTVSRPMAWEKTTNVEDITSLHTTPYHMSYLPMSSLTHIIPCPVSDSCDTRVHVTQTLPILILRITVTEKSPFVYYESIRWEVKRRPIYECRCDERLETKVGGSTRLEYTGFLVTQDSSPRPTQCMWVT